MSERALRSALTSPGAATADRALVERRLDRAVQAAMGRYLRWARARAVAEPTEFTAGEAHYRWDSDVVPVVLDAVRRVIPAAARDAPTVQTYLRGLDARLRAHPLPDDVYLTARSTLTALSPLTSGQPVSLRRRQRAVREALSPGTATTIGLDRDRVPVVEGVAWQARLAVLVRTEATAAVNEARLVDLAREGFRSKRWISHHDALVRSTHLAANGQTVPLTAQFTVGGALLMTPGDPSGPAEEVLNCRCSMVGVGGTAVARRAAR